MNDIKFEAESDHAAVQYWQLSLQVSLAVSKFSDLGSLLTATN